MAVAGGRYDNDDGAPSRQPWHNRTPEVIGASVIGLIVIGVLVFAVSFAARQFGQPEEAPLNFVEPTFSRIATSGSGAPTTTQTITSTSPPQTTDLEPAPPPTTTSGSETSTDETTAEDDSEEDDETTGRPTRRGPRTNVTRTLNPYYP